MNTRLLTSAAIVVAATSMCALAAPPKQAAEQQKLDDIAVKLNQELWEKAHGLIPREDEGAVLRGPCPFTVTRSPNLPIPQFNVTPGVVTDQVTTAGDPLQNVRVHLIIPHTWQGDVIARLRHEASGVEVTLIDRPGSPQSTALGFNADNFGNNTTAVPFVLDDSAAATYDFPQVAAPGTTNVTGSWKPDDVFLTLAAFNGLTGNTTWTITVSDNAAGDLGTLVRWALCTDSALGQGVPTGIGSASPVQAPAGTPVTFTVAVTPAQAPPSTGLGVSADLSAVGGSANQMFFDNGTNGDAVSGDNVFSYATVVAGATGNYSLPFTISDAQARTGTGTIAFGIVAANDACPGDVVTAPSSTSGTTVGMTPSGVTSCGANSADAYYQFTPVFSGSYTIDTCGSSFDTRLSIFTDCPALSQVGCNDDACGLQSRLILDLSAGTTYYIRVSAFGAAVTGSFVLNISAPPVPSGGCCIAGNCTVQLQPDCASLGGSYLGDNAPCVTPGPNEFSYTSNPFLSLPDNACTTLGFSTDSISVPDSFTVGDVNVRVQITHTFVGDLRIRLTNGATTVAVWERVCGTNENMDVTFDDQGATLVCSAPVFGTYVPSGTGAGSLSSFNGQGSSGTWTLEVCDGAGVDLGTLDSWTLILRDSGENPCGGGPQFCDADWCHDGSVGVPDIFCFLSAWFANDPAARNYGGTNGVPAIFAFLSIWFATGQGPCTP